MKTIREYAESILLAETLEEKLAAPPVGLSLDPPHKGSYRSPDLPGRPSELRPRTSNEARTKIPSSEQLANEDHRSVLLHFFCNHELIAVELMALALLKFPDAPDAFRRGLLHTLQEEQEHTRLYLDRMAATGASFGEHSLSRMIWDHIAPMSSPIEYVSRLSLTFEQSNLDYAHHYAQAFAKISDHETSTLLEKIYKDEIAHVGYGLKWLRRFKEEQQSDWDAWHNSLAHPLSPIRAKAPEGTIPFNEEGRRKAGFDSDFLNNLKLYQRSRGRTPNVHFFNPNCEARTAAEENKQPYMTNKPSRHLEQDLEALLFANAQPDDLVLMRVLPRKEHLARLKEAGLILPETALLQDDTCEQLTERKLGGFRPWAWCPESSQLFEKVADNPTSNTLHPWRTPLPGKLYSKALTSELTEQLAITDNPSRVFTNLEKARTHILAHQKKGLPLLLKPLLSCAGKGHLKVDSTTAPGTVEKWLQHQHLSQGGLVAEPFYQRVLDFSALYDISQKGEVRFIAFTRLLTDDRGHYRGTRVAPKIGNLFPPDLTILFHQALIRTDFGEYSGPSFYKKIVPTKLQTLLPGYSGPVSIDAFFHQQDKDIKVRPVVEINVRCSMGRIAHNLRRQLTPNSAGELTIHRMKELAGTLPAGLPLNDPQQAQSFLAVWSETESNTH